MSKSTKSVKSQVHDYTEKFCEQLTQILKINTQPCDLQQKLIKYEINARDHAVSIYRTNLFFRSSLLLITNFICSLQLYEQKLQ